jgi:hypothetical protein
MFKKILGLVSGFCFLVSLAYAQEQITITTYYPSPYGSYRELRSQRMAIGTNYIDGATYCWGAGCGTNVIPDAASLVVEGNVGIGTTAPNAKLEIKGFGSTDFIRLYATTSYPVISSLNNLSIKTATNGPTLFLSGLANGIAVGYNYADGSHTPPGNGAIIEGSVGIGTTGPTDILTVVKANDETFLGLSGAAGSHTSIALGRTAGEGRLGVAASAGQYAAGAAAGDLVLRVDSSSQKLHLLAGAGNAVMTITSGNVGIGTTSPSQKLDVAGYVKGQSGLCVGSDCRTSWPTATLSCQQKTGTITAAQPYWSGHVRCDSGYKITGATVFCDTGNVPTTHNIRAGGVNVWANGIEAEGMCSAYSANGVAQVEIICCKIN